VPAHGIAVSVLCNALDSAPGLWLDGILHILSRFKLEGAPTAKVRDWTGRWWGGWGAVDLVPMGDKVVVAAPGMATPFLKVSELAVTGRDKARIVQAGAYASYGEPVQRIRSKNGKVTAIHASSGRMLSEAALARELTARYD
jgi:hypothetical protein